MLTTYEAHINEDIASGDFEKLLSPAEKIYIKKLKRIVIRGKRGRGVPVLFDQRTKEALDLTISCRSNFHQISNIYLFELCSTEGPISGYHVFRKHVTKALGDPKKVASLTSTKLRKHLATISQILKMDNEELEQLAGFMGHSTKTHQEWYRLPSDIYQTAKVSKVLLMSQKTSIEKYKGKSLSDLDVDYEIVETDESDNEEIDKEDDKEIDMEIDEPQIKKINSDKRIKKVIKKPWTQEEKRITELFFKSHIQQSKAPKKHEVLQLTNMHPELFKCRKWNTIKVYVCNKYNQKK